MHHLAVIVMLLGPCGLSAQADEPNDVLVAATTTTLSDIGDVALAGTLGDGDHLDRDVDLYSFELSDVVSLPVLLTVELSATGGALDAYLRLFDAMGIELVNNDDRALDEVDPRIQTFLLRPGVYYVGVSSVSNPRYDNTIGGSGRPGLGGTYGMTVIIAPASLPTSPLEPNDHIDTAIVLGGMSQVVTGEFIGDGPHARLDVDMYLLTLDRAARIDVQVRAEAIGSLLDPVLRLRHCEDGIDRRTTVDDCLLGASDDGPFGSVDAKVSGGILEATDVYIMVSGAGNRRYDPSRSGSGEPGSVGHYDLLVTVTYFDVGGPDEPNDSISMATPAALFVSGRPEEVEIEGFLGDGWFWPFGGDRDFYEVKVVDAPRILTVEVAAVAIGSALDPVATVYNSDGELVARNDNAAGSVDARIVVPTACLPVAEDSVSAYVLVTGTRQRPPLDPFQPYADARVVESQAIEDGRGSTGAYRLTLGASAVEEQCTNEIDDTLATATETGLVDDGQYVCIGGLFGDARCEDPLRDIDIWSVRVAHVPVWLEVSVLACRADPIETFAIALFDAEGETLAIVDSRFPVEPFQILIEKPGTYFVAVADVDIRIPSFDPQVPCTAPQTSGTTFDLVITLRSRSTVDGRGAGAEADEPDASRLFVTRLDDQSDAIDVVDTATGDSIATFAAPEPRFGGSEGLAYDGSTLYYVGVGLYPKLYQLDPATGEVTDEYVLWTGSGFYSDAAMLAGNLYLLDYRGRSIHVLDPVGRRFLRTLHVGTRNDVTIAGGLAALAGPGRLYAADAFNSRAIYEIDPMTGGVTKTLLPTTLRPVGLGAIGESRLFLADWLFPRVEVIDRTGAPIGSLDLVSPVGSMAGAASIGAFGDFDGDADIDLMDYAAFQLCFFGSEAFPTTDCDASDRNSDGYVNLLDFSMFPAAATGP